MTPASPLPMEWFPPAESRIARTGWITFGAWVLTVTVAAFLHPDSHGHGTHRQLGLAPCPSVALLGRPCPGCGLTTSWTALVHGQIGASFHAHPLGPILFALFTAWAFLGLRGALTGRRVDFLHPAMHRLLIAVAVVFFGFGLARFLLVSEYASPQEAISAIRR